MSLFFAQEPSVLTRISALQVDDENGHKSIIGILYKTNHKYGGMPHIGTVGPVPAQRLAAWREARTYNDLKLHRDVPSCDEADMHHFEVDGPGGEVVCEICVTRDRSSVKFVTSRGREYVFGKDEVDEDMWESIKAGDGERIVGICARFGELGGWSETAAQWSHWTLNDLGVIVERVEI